MFKYMVTYKDYNDVTRTEDLYFNLNKAELTDIQFDLGGSSGNFEEVIIKIISEQDQKRIMEIFKSLIDKSYGEKSPDGKYFFKNEEILAKFKASPAYEIMYMRLGSDSKFASEFVNKVYPKDIQEAAKESQAEVEAKIAPYLPQFEDVKSTELENK